MGIVYGLKLSASETEKNMPFFFYNGSSFNSTLLCEIYSTMESENRVAVEVEKRIIGVTTKVENIKKEVENDCNGAEIQTKNEVSKPTVDAKGPISAGDKVVIEASKTSANKNSKGAKVPYRMYLNYYYYLFQLNYWS